MVPDRWQRVEAIFEQVTELADGEHPGTLGAREKLAGLYETWGRPAPPS